MAGFENSVLVAKNMNFDQAAPNPHLGVIDASGKLPIGTGQTFPTPEILGGSLVSPNGTIIIGYDSPNITLEVNTSGPLLSQIIVQAGITPVVPTSGTITVGGTYVTAQSVPVITFGTAASSYVTQVQLSSAQGSSATAHAGLCSFNSGQFTVDSAGFVSSIGGGFEWVDVTGATQTVEANMGYLANAGGGVAFTLPAASSIGDVFRIVGVQASWTLAQNASQQILFGDTATTVGVGGSLASTDAGDCAAFVAITTGAASIYRVMSSMGNITVV